MAVLRLQSGGGLFFSRFWRRVLGTRLAAFGVRRASPLWVFPLVGKKNNQSGDARRTPKYLLWGGVVPETRSGPSKQETVHLTCSTPRPDSSSGSPASSTPPASVRPATHRPSPRRRSAIS